MAEQAGPEFAALLRRLRAGAGLTQEELAEAAGLSPRSVSDLERGVHRAARQDTARLLADALGLAGPERALFVAAARGHAPAVAAEGGLGGVAAVTRTLPRDIAAFTGRAAELDQLTDALAGAAAGGGVVGICAIGGMAGIGKTTLAVHAAHQLAQRFPDGQLFVPLHAHTPGQRPVGPADALASLLLAAGVAAQAIPPGLDARAALWRDHLAGKKVLLVLDDAAGHAQVRPLLPGTAGCLVLITSRRRLAALEDAAVISLDTLAPGEAAELLARLAGHPGLGAGEAGVEEITRLCGYLPLAIGMVASQLRHHPAWTADGLAGQLAAARDRLELMAAENLSVAAAFDLSYRDLTGRQRRLFRCLGLIPGTDFDAHAAAALDGVSLQAARRQLAALYDQHLITEPAAGRYRLHDLLRAHARALAAADDPAARQAASIRLLEYYLHTALAARQHLGDSIWAPAAGSLPPARPPACAPPVSAPRQAAAWLEAERASLDAAARYAAASGLSRYAMLLPAALDGFLQVRGHWDQALALHQLALAAARQAGDRAGQAQILRLLAGAQFMTGGFAAAKPTFRQALELCRDLGDRAGQADALCGLGKAHEMTDDYRSAAACHRQALELFRKLGHRTGEARALEGLGEVQWMTGDYPDAAANLQQAVELFRDAGDRLGQASVLYDLGHVHLLTGDYPAAAAAFGQAQPLSRDVGDRMLQAQVLDELGVLQRLTGDYRAAATSCQQALEQFRDLGERNGQCHALNNLGLVQQLTGDHLAAAASHQQSLRLARDLGQPNEQADALNSLGELACRTAGSQQARDHHTQALAITRQTGAPLEQARALEGIGRSHLHDGHIREGTAHLKQALAIYQRIGAPATQRVQETLHQQQATTQA